MFTITVSGGSGSVAIDFGHAACEAVSLISPDNTPMYNFAITNANGIFVVGADSIDVQKTKISENFRLDGVCTLSITSAADDGNYSVEIFPR